MKREEQNELLIQINKFNPNAEIIFMSPSELVFEENVKMNCFYCGKYGNNWRCPPNLPDIDYKKMFAEYDEGAFVSLTYDTSDAVRFAEIRNESSLVLHKLLLMIEKWMYDHNRANAISFGAGSCRLCKGGCGKDKCNNPYMSRSPLEATGVNVIKSVRKYGVDITFPTNNVLRRVGLVVWQNEI